MRSLNFYNAKFPNVWLSRLLVWITLSGFLAL
nr:MAG TPA: hypothetical protein [Caudoviricetes sp.]